MNLIQTSAQSARSGLKRNKPSPLALEARLMFDGAAIATPVPPPDALPGDAPDAGIVERALPVEKGVAAVETEREGAQAFTALPKEIVFVDAGVNDWQKLLEGVDPGAEVIVLDPSRDGLTQIAEALQGHSGLDAIHVVSHGVEGGLILGGTTYTDQAIGDYQAQFSAIGQALSESGDILLYGCDIAKGTAGEAFVNAVAQATAADVAASNDTTGNAALGGDWDLEHSAGVVTADAFASQAALEAYEGVLASYDRSFSVQERETDVGYLSGRGYSIDNSSPDASKFSISESWGLFTGWRTYLTFKETPNFEAPTDTGGVKAGDNIYVLRLTKGGDTYTTTVTVTDVNENPIARNDSATISENAKVTTHNVLLNDTADPDTGSATSITGARVTSVFGLAGIVGLGAEDVGVRVVTVDGKQQLEVTLGNDFDMLKATNPTITVQYTIAGSNGGTDTANLTLTVNGANDPATITKGATGTVTESNTTPIKQDFEVQDVDFSSIWVPDADRLEWDSYASQTGTYGRLTFQLLAGTWTYTMAEPHESLAQGQELHDIFKVTAADGTPLTIDITIQGENDAPIVSAITGDANEDGPATKLTSSFSDVDTGDTHTFTINTTGTKGIVVNNNDGTFTYNPNGKFETLAVGQTATDTFTYTVKDKAGAEVSNTATITITGTNDAPKITNDSFRGWSFGSAKETVTDGTAQVFDANSFDIDTGDTIKWSLTSGDTQLFSIDSSTGIITAMHTANLENDYYTLTVKATDLGGLGLSATRNVMITVKNVNDPAVFGGALTGSVDENEGKVWISGKIDVTDVDSFDLMRLDGQLGKYGVFTIEPGGTWFYRMGQDHDELNLGNGFVETFKVKSYDGTETYVKIAIVGSDDLSKVAGNSSGFITESDVAESVGGKLTVADVDGTPVSDGKGGWLAPTTTSFVTETEVGKYGSLKLAADGSWTYVMDSAHDEFEAGLTYTDTFTVATTDGVAQLITVTIEGTSDPIPVNRVAGGAGGEGNPGGINFGSGNIPGVTGFRGDISGTGVPGQSNAPGGRGQPGFNPEALLASAPTAAGFNDLGDGEFQKFELALLDLGDKSDYLQVFVPAGTKMSFDLPADLMQGAQAPDFFVTLNNGEALPDWLVFDPMTGKFIGRAPDGMVGTLSILLNGKDAQGRDRTIRILLTVDAGERSAVAASTLDGKPVQLADTPAKMRANGRAGLTDQLQTARQVRVAAKV